MFSRIVKANQMASVMNKFAAKNAPVFVMAPRKFSTQAYPTIPADATNEQIANMVDDYHTKTYALPEEATFFGGWSKIVEKNGWIPFLGLGAAALVSKELFHINAELVVLCNTSFVMFIIYTLGSDKLETIYMKSRTDEIQNMKNVFQAKKDIIKANIECCESVVNKPLVIRDINTAFIEANAAAAVANAKKAEQANKDATLTRLNQIYVKEQSEIAARREEIRQKSRDYVKQNITSAAVKASVLKEAISLVGATEDKTGVFVAVDTLIKDAIKMAQK